MRSAEVSLTCGLVEHCTVDVSMHLNIYGFVDKSSHIGMNVNDRSTLSYSHIRHPPHIIIPGFTRRGNSVPSKSVARGGCSQRQKGIALLFKERSEWCLMFPVVWFIVRGLFNCTLSCDQLSASDHKRHRCSCFVFRLMHMYIDYSGKIFSPVVLAMMF